MLLAPLSTTPSQSLSLPSHVSATGLHWQTLDDWPGSALHVQPATQLAADVQASVQTLMPPPIGRQMPLVQSPFLAQAFPASPCRAWQEKVD
jgi:hypothetical protein